ncbi:hypothetical protein AVEN_266135-1 [Araneus ventricosus]|uniref:CUB domain-containing protein n=1 Tax=Araneus ventricosus TaxID=182803 RepID=A0A4Y2G885_ARAVE|nr:hypothetical protein AVEN_266135-1 [Araneus ventricosus]
MRCLLLLLVASWTGWSVAVPPSPCKSWEFRCGNDRCITHNRFCDGTDDCGDSSDEPTGCTNCNQTLMGEVGTKYPLRITEPFQRNLPFVCKLHLVAGGGSTLGERLEITFLSFQIGSLTLDSDAIVSSTRNVFNTGNRTLCENVCSESDNGSLSHYFRVHHPKLMRDLRSRNGM